MLNYEIVTFVNDEMKLDVNVSPSEDTVWLSKEEMALLFQRDRSVISRHIANIYKEGELIEKSTCAKNAHVHSDKRHRKYENFLYNLDVIISVGYRVKSKTGILFRKWANSVLKEYLLKGYAIDEGRALITDENYINLINKVDSIDKRLSLIEKSNVEKEKIFFDGEMFDAKAFISNIISSAKNSIILIDAYADIKALDFLKHKKRDVTLSIYHSSKAKLSSKDIAAFNMQYGNCSAFVNNRYHDRFIIVDDKKYYHLGASLNYAGKKVFAISRMEDEEILKSIKKGL